LRVKDDDGGGGGLEDGGVRGFPISNPEKNGLAVGSGDTIMGVVSDGKSTGGTVMGVVRDVGDTVMGVVGDGFFALVSRLEASYGTMSE
jgi:hypothetical protein